MRIAYVVSRFPVASETFVLRELNAIDGRDGIRIELFALFRPVRPFTHPDARPWLDRVRRVGAGRAARALAWWLVRRPGPLVRAVAELVRAYARRPARLARALATVPLAAEHARLVRMLGVEHVHAHFATYPAISAWLCGRLTGVPYSITAHAHDIFVDQSHLTTLVREASFIAVISEFNRTFLAAYGAGNPTPVHVVRCGVDPEAYAFRPRGEPPVGPVRALCVASLEEYKGHAFLLEALASGGELERIQLDLVGAGSLEAELRESAARLGLDGRVRFLGQQDEEQVAALLGAADVFVLPSIVARDGQMEGIPVALMEALAAGIPVVATRLSGIPELVQHGVTGLLAEPGDAASMAAALRALLADPAAATQRAVAGRSLVEREFDVARSAARLRALFRGAGAEAQAGVTAGRSG